MSRLGYGSEGYSDDSGRENGSRRQKMLGYLKAANEIRQSYQSSFSQKLYAERGVDAPGAFPDYDMTSPGEEEMVLFPSYARRHVKNSRRDGPIQDQPLPGTEEDIDRPRSPPGDVEYWREEWERYEDSNAIVDVDVRGWLYTPQNGPMNRKQRLMVALARKLSDIPPPTVTTNNPVQRHVAKREEEDARREAQYLVNKGEQDADVVWRTNHAENADSDSDMPKRVTRAGTDTSLDKNDLTGLNANLMERLRPFMYNPSVDSPVTVFFYNDQQSQSRTTVTNESGHFNIRAALEFVPTHVRVLASSESLSTTEEVKIVEPAGVSLISDIDDTIKHSAIASGAKEVFWNTFIRDFNDLTIDGVKEWYNRLADMGVGIHYVSNAPWQLYPQLKTYFKLAGLPSGSFHLKQYSGMLQGIFEPTAERKRMSLEKIMRDFPERKFILVGDSGEADLEVYTELVQQNPGRILGVFIRDVTTTEKREFFDNSFGQKRAGYNATSGFKDTADSIEKRPPLPPRQPSSAKTINNGDLMTFEDEASSSDNGGNMSDKSAVKGPPAKPSKPPGLRTAVTMPTPEPIRRNPAPRLPSKPSSLSSTPNESANEAEKKPPPLPQRKPVQQSETYTDAVKNLAMDVYNNIPSTKDTLGSLSNLSLKNDTTTTTRQEAPNSTATSTKRGAPPPVPPARRSVNATSASDMERKNSNNTPPAPPPRLPSRQSTLSSIASSTSTKQTGAFTTTNSNNSVPNFGYYDSTSEAPPPSSSQQPMRNKREELWKRRWERAQRILSDQGVLLGSWRVGSDVQDVSVWIVENAMKNKLTKKKSAMAGRLVDDK